MCGILGTVNVPLERRQLDLLAHRGPDGQGLASYSVAGHHVEFGHRRLAIVDLSDLAAQPMASADGDHHIIFNGEIYNHRELRGTLGPSNFRSHSDTESLLYALAKFGINAVNRLNGIFAFAYLDKARARLYLVRDPFGVKPIYYTSNSQQFHFASELRPLLEVSKSEIDEANLATLLKFRFVPSPGTLCKNIRKVRPGHLIELDLSHNDLRCREICYVPQYSKQRSRTTSFRAEVDSYGHFFESAVARQLMSDVEIGVLLSGGIDSALVAAAARKALDHPLKAFTVGFKEITTGGVDEIEDARATAVHLGLEHFTTRIGFDDFLEALRECVQIVEEPLATSSIVPMHHLAKLAAREVKVVLSGQGADEPLGGYQRYQVELYRNLIPPLLASLGLRLAISCGSRKDALVRGLRSLSERTEVAGFREAYAVFTNDEIQQLLGYSVAPVDDPITYYFETLDLRALSSSVERMMSIDLRLGLADDLLLYTDKITMHESLECRVPMLDNDLIEFLESLPRGYRLGKGRTKIIHKAYAERVLPSKIIQRPKRGFLSPTQTWFRDAGKLRSLLVDRSAGFTRYFNVDFVDRVIEQHRRGHNRERQLFLLLCIRFWMDSYIS